MLNLDTVWRRVPLPSVALTRAIRWNESDSFRSKEKKGVHEGKVVVAVPGSP